MNITVTWGGVDSHLELTQIFRNEFGSEGQDYHIHRGSIGEPSITLDRCHRLRDDRIYWDATTRLPPRLVGWSCSWYGVGPKFCIVADLENAPSSAAPSPIIFRCTGQSAQEALDGLAECLTSMATWAFAVLRPGQEELHFAPSREGSACNAVGRMRYTHDLGLFESLVGIVPTCAECVAHMHEDGDDDED